VSQPFAVRRLQIYLEPQKVTAQSPSMRKQWLRVQEIALTAYVCKKRGAILVKWHSRGIVFGARIYAWSA